MLAAGQLVESLGGFPDGQDVLVSFFSIFSAAGRLACGLLPEAVWHRYNVPRYCFHCPIVVAFRRVSHQRHLQIVYVACLLLLGLWSIA